MYINRKETLTNEKIDNYSIPVGSSLSSNGNRQKAFTHSQRLFFYPVSDGRVRRLTMESEKTVISQEGLKETIDRIMGKLNSCENPDEIEAIRKTIKQNVPFTRRGYFSALLLEELLKAPQARGERRERGERKEKKEARESKEPRKEASAEKPQTDETAAEKKEKVLPEGAKTLYLNVGKMKHLYAKNLSLMLQKELGITRDDIYSLRVHDKYSFITMSEENCEKAIAAFNGKDINGREAQLSYSNK